MTLLLAQAAFAAPYEEWAGMYLGKEKMGYAYLKAEDVPGGYDITEEMTAALTVLGTVQEVKIKTSSITDGGYRVKSFHFSMVSGFADATIDGVVDGNTLRLKTGPGQSDSEAIKLKETPFLSSGADLYIQNQKLKAGDSMELPLFDPASLSLQQMKVNVESVEEMKEGEGLVPVYKVRESYSGIDGTSWISPRLGTLKSSGPMGFTFLKETKEQALNLKINAPPDITALTAVPAEGEVVADPRSVLFMKVKLEGADLSGMALDGGRQVFSGGILSAEKEDLSGIKPAQFPVKGPGLDEFLKPQPFVQSDDPRIIKQAGEITGGEKDTLKAARKLLGWVYDNLRKYPSAGIPNAVEVLQNLSGDCNEHATLFMALARAAGIPARMDAGLVLMNGKFYYHAWNEIYVGQWVTVDPTFGQFPADASHIRLAEGGPDKQVELIKAVGKLKITVLETR
ncbi:MAG: transglutaminase-like domain-containing protein [Nitrospirota bacterium]